MSEPSTPSHSFTGFLTLSAATSSQAASSSSSHLCDLARPCRLLDTPSAVRCLVLDYLDDTSAIRCLSSCRSLHAGYHSYPVKRAVSVESLQQLFKLDVQARYESQIGRCRWLVIVVGIVNVVNTSLLRGGIARVLPPVLWGVVAIAALLWLYRWQLVRRKSCCVKGWRLDPWRGGPMLRVTRLRESLRGSEAAALPAARHRAERHVQQRLSCQEVPAASLAARTPTVRQSRARSRARHTAAKPDMAVARHDQDRTTTQSECCLSR